MKNSHSDRRTRYSLQMIRLALFQLLEEKELSAITVTDICKAADINRGTFYKYYRDVGDLFYQIEKEFSESLHAVFKETEAEDFDIKQFLLDTLQIISKNRDFIHVIRKGNTTSRLVEDIMSVIRPYSFQIIQKAYPDSSSVKQSYLLEYRLGGIINMIVKWLEDDMVIPFKEMQEMIIQIVGDVPVL